MNTNELENKVARLEKLCTFEGCTNKHHSKGYCATHYGHLKTYGEPRVIKKLVLKNKGQICSVQECPGEAKVTGLCHKHYQRIRVHGDVTKNKNEERMVNPSIRLCEVEGCYDKHSAKGYCGKHAWKFERYGDPLGKPLSAEEVFWANVNKDTSTGCWVWTKSLKANGYGYFRKKPIHRYSWGLVYGEIPSNIHVHHKCAVRKCVNPEHLQLLVPRENNAEMYERNTYIKYISYLESEVNRLRALVGENELPTNNTKEN